jgi:hypothetical protein
MEANQLRDNNHGNQTHTHTHTRSQHLKAQKKSPNNNSSTKVFFRGSVSKKKKSNKKSRLLLHRRAPRTATEKAVKYFSCTRLKAHVRDTSLPVAVVLVFNAFDLAS